MGFKLLQQEVGNEQNKTGCDGCLLRLGEKSRGSTATLHFCVCSKSSGFTILKQNIKFTKESVKFFHLKLKSSQMSTNFTGRSHSATICYSPSATTERISSSQTMHGQRSVQSLMWLGFGSCCLFPHQFQRKKITG